MRLASLEVRGLRCLREVPELLPHPEFNLITGPNAAGKTTFLEAIDLLARGRSFRSHQPKELITKGEKEYLLRGQVEPAGRGKEPTPFTLSQRRTTEKLELRCDGEPVKGLSEIAPRLAVQAIHPDSHALVHGPPARRRAWLDWGVFHVEPEYRRNWASYQRTLKQRNAALKNRNQDPTPWDHPLAEAGEILTAMRRSYLEEIRDPLEGFAQILLPEKNLEINYLPGYDESAGLEGSLVAGLASSRESGQTTTGPHRAELALALDGMPATRIASRGQSKLLSCCLLLAQVALFQELRDESCVLLFDDLSAELDGRHLGLLLEALSGSEAQLFVTRVQDDPLSASPQGFEGRVFHVEQGSVSLTSGG